MKGTQRRKNLMHTMIWNQIRLDPWVFSSNARDMFSSREQQKLKQSQSHLREKSIGDI